MAYRILTIHYGGHVGGAPVSLLQLAASLDRRRFEPRVVFTHSGPILEFAARLGIRARVVPLRSAFCYGAHVPLRPRMLATFLLYYRQTLRHTRALIRRERPDLVHLNTSVLLPVAVAVKREGIPLVWHVRESPGPSALVRRWQLGTVVRLADRVVVTTDYLKGLLPADGRVRLVRNALDLARFRIDEASSWARLRAELGIPESARVVAMLGSVQGVKGHYLLVDAAAQVAAAVPDARFLVVAGGAGPEYDGSWRARVKRILRQPRDNCERMERRIERAGLGRHFVFTGFRWDIPEVLAASDAVAFLPQRPEGFGRPLIEAMAMGRAVVATDIGPTREIVGDDAGLLVSPGDVHAVATALARVLEDEALRRRLGEAGRRRVESRHTLEAAVAAVERLYLELLERGPVQAAARAQNALPGGAMAVPQ